jgi:TatA/E family protein of Tat protein translocase
LFFRRVAGNSSPQYDGNMNLGFPEMIFLFILALLIFGPKKLPEIGRQIGKAMNEFKRASNEFKAQIESEINQLDLENERKIMPSFEPPEGAIAALPLRPEPAASHEPDPALKAPNA